LSPFSGPLPDAFPLRDKGFLTLHPLFLPPELGCMGLFELTNPFHRLPGVLANLLNQGVAFDLFDQSVRLGRPYLFE
jgi:hypothetical protein